MRINYIILNNVKTGFDIATLYIIAVVISDWTYILIVILVLSLFIKPLIFKEYGNKSGDLL